MRAKRLTLTAATLGAFVALLDSTAVGVALPAIGGDLGSCRRGARSPRPSGR